MKRIYLINSLKDFLSSASAKPSDCVVINLNNQKMDGLSIDNKFSVVTLKENDNKTTFDREYINFIASLAKKSHRLYWWASALSEKNSFLSKLFSRLYTIICLGDTLKNISIKNIVIICSDSVLKKQIVYNFKNSYDVKLPLLFHLQFYLQKTMFILIGILKRCVKALIEYKHVWFARKHLRAKINDIYKHNNYVVLRTWADHRSYKTGSYNDPYFKRLLNYLVHQNESVLIFTGCIGNYEQNILRFENDPDNLIIPTNFYLCMSDVVRSLLGTIFRRPSVSKNISFRGKGIFYLIADELLRDIATSSFFSALIEYYSCQRLAENISIKKFIHTFENYTWEKMSNLGLKSHNWNITTVGFQHAFISRNSFKYFPGVAEKAIAPLPNKIVTMGKRTREIMENFGNYPEGLFSTGCALRQEYLFKLPTLPRNVDGGIFIPLTITVEDTVKVLNFIFEAGLGGFPDKIYLRFHPTIQVKKVLKRINFSLPSNFIISENPPVHKELERCSVVLYTFTTVCLEALKMSRPVIYLDVNYPLELDPLFEYSGLKTTCRKPAELKEKIETFRRMDDSIFTKEFNKANNYLNDYFGQVSDQALSVFIQ